MSVPDEKVIGTFNAEKNELALLDKNMAVEKFAHWHGKALTTGFIKIAYLVAHVCLNTINEYPFDAAADNY